MKLAGKIATGIAALMMTAGSAVAADVPQVITPVAPPPPPPTVEEARNGGPYVSVFGGLLDWPPVDVEFLLGEQVDAIIYTDFGWRAGGAIGLAIDRMLAVELEGTYGRVPLAGYEIPAWPWSADITEGTSDLLTIMGNLRLGPTTGTFRPYVAGGGGVARVGLNIPAGQIGDDEAVGADWTWGAQGMAGIDIGLADSVSIGARYRFQYIGPTEFQDAGGDDIFVGPFGTHTFEVVLTIGLGGR